MLGSEHLTDQLSTQLSTVRGMAHFAGTGPQGKTCDDCALFTSKLWRVFLGGQFLSFKQGRCNKFLMLTGKRGTVIKWQSQGGYPAACKYFVNQSQPQELTQGAEAETVKVAG